MIWGVHKGILHGHMLWFSSNKHFLILTGNMSHWYPAMGGTVSWEKWLVRSEIYYLPRYLSRYLRHRCSKIQLPRFEKITYYGNLFFFSFFFKLRCWNIFWLKQLCSVFVICRANVFLRPHLAEALLCTQHCVCIWFRCWTCRCLSIPFILEQMMGLTITRTRPLTQLSDNQGGFPMQRCFHASIIVIL